MSGGYLIIDCSGHGINGNFKIDNIYNRIKNTNKPVLLENWHDNIKSILLTFQDDDDGFLRARAEMPRDVYNFTVKSDGTLTITDLPIV